MEGPPSLPPLALSEEDLNPHWDDLASLALASPPPQRPPTTTTPTPQAPPDISDLDPYAPTQRTLGETTAPSSKLELIPGSSSDEDSPVQPALPLPVPAPQSPPKKKPANLSLGSGTPSTFLGGMFRSLSGAGGATTPPVSSVQVSPTQAASPSAVPNPILGLAGLIRGSTPSGSGENSAASSTFGTPEKVSGFTQPPQASTSNADSVRDSPAAREKGTQQKQDEEEEVVFDFNKFLEQMRQRSADPIAKYLRSFLKEFSRRPPLSPSDQVRVINDFLDFIAGKMRSVDPWKSILLSGSGPRADSQDAEGLETRGEMEFDMALEAMEKLVMNRLWHLTFTPALDTSGGGQNNTDDLERDHVLSQRIRLFNWIEPKHLDLPAGIVSPSPASSPAPSSPVTGGPAPSPLVGGPSSPSSRSATAPALTVSPSSPDSKPAPTTHTAPSKKKSSTLKAAKQTSSFLLFAQRELAKINDYKAPRDKMICILNCCKVIFGLIRHVTPTASLDAQGADAFIPFLIFVVLRTNPRHLVSNLQYIQRFRNPAKLAGEAGYYLSSLTGAISFIETMDASSLSCLTQAEFEANVEAAILSLPIDPNDTSLRLSHTPTEANFPSTSAHSPRPASALPLPPAPPPKNFLVRGTENVERIVSKPLNAISRILDALDPPPPPPPPSSVATPRRRSSGGSTNGGGSAGNPRDLEVVKRIEELHETKRKAALETLKGVFPQLEAEVLEMVLLSTGGEVGEAIERVLEMS